MLYQPLDEPKIIKALKGVKKDCTDKKCKYMTSNVPNENLYWQAHLYLIHDGQFFKCPTCAKVLNKDYLNFHINNSCNDRKAASMLKQGTQLRHLKSNCISIDASNWKAMQISFQLNLTGNEVTIVQNQNDSSW